MCEKRQGCMHPLKKFFGEVQCCQVGAVGTSVPEHGVAVIKGVCPTENYCAEVFHLLKKERTENKSKQQNNPPAVTTAGSADFASSNRATVSLHDASEVGQGASALRRLSIPEKSHLWQILLKCGPGFHNNEKIFEICLKDKDDKNCGFFFFFLF